ncbi:MAG: hypothetical protein H7A21_01820 [Spirochaetales bacterium]|nr:hypothetical protein [Leptospiraceae bacterium]MCP5480143.1 hypothetical protein [Spirochaetales bacterium]MCP5485517.1 hypothetical protein [Spirochaetales bacterium]
MNPEPKGQPEAGRLLRPLELILFTATLAFFFVFNFTSLPGSMPRLLAAGHQTVPFEARMFFAPEDVPRTLDDLGAAGREAYLDLLRLDMFFPPVYCGFFLVSLLQLRAGRGFVSRLGRWLYALPAVLLVCDYIENLTLWHLLAQYPASADACWTVLAISTPAKALLFVGLLLLVLTGYAHGAFLRLRNN